MKKLLYLLLTVLMVLPATAYGQMSQAPTISYEENQDQLTIIVHGPGLLNVQVLRDHDHDWNFDIVLDEAQVEDHYEFTILRSYDDSFEGMVIATAKEDDHPTSEAVTSQFVMRPYFIMPLPEITFTDEDNGVTCTVTNICPTFEITADINGEPYLYDSYPGGDVYSFFVEQTYEEQNIFVNAQNKGVSHGDIGRGATASYTLAARELPVAEMPEITVTEGDEYYTISAQSYVEGAIVHLLLDGEEVENPYSIWRIDVEQTFVVMAYVEAPDMLPSEWVQYTILVPALPVTATPVLTIDEGDEYYTVYAYCTEEEATVHLLLNGEEVDNPFYIWRIDEDQIFDVMAYAEAPGMQQSVTVVYTVLVPAVSLPPEETAAPSVNCRMTTLDDGRDAAIITMVPNDENSVIYFRYCVNGEDFSDWMPYDDEMWFIDPGNYLIEAYAIAEYKLPSAVVCISFSLTQPIINQLYDFIEDDIFYKFTSEGKVSVCSETRAYNAYSGDVSIPATVTHDGVTYMVTAIDDNAFRDCPGLTSVSIGAYVTSIGNDAFMDCKSLTSVTLGDYVISLGSGAFDGCTSLATVKMGSGLARIGERAFNGCGELTDIYCKAATPPVMASSNCFETDTYGTATLHVYPAVLDSYRGNDYWNQFNNIVGEDNVAPAAGDVNGDGTMSIGDVTTLIHLLLGGE